MPCRSTATSRATRTWRSASPCCWASASPRTSTPRTSRPPSPNSGGRWHISLSSWLRDYLYISLGGNRKGKLRTYGNLLVTMVLGGLWHGAAIALHPLGRAARRSAGAAQTVDGRRPGRQGHRGADALVEPCGGHLLHVQPRLPGLADVPRRVDADRRTDAAPDLLQLQRPQ